METPPSLSSASRSRTVRRVGFALLALLVLAGGATYQIGVRSKRPPHFRRGGAFVRQTAASPSGSALGAPVTDDPATTAPTSVVTAGAGAAESSGVPDDSAPGPASNANPASPGVRGRAAAAAPVATAAPSTTAGPAAAPATSGLPQLGTYTWNVNGSETATGFGSRSFPSTMTMTAHRDSSLAGDELVLDTTYSSDHTEREILGYRADGVFMEFEAGQVRFGPMAQTNEGDYKPPMLQVPSSGEAGAKQSGRSTVTASDGSTQRTEDWTVTMGGHETVTIAGAAVSTVVVTIERQTTPGSDQQVHRTRTYWYDPVRHLWVKYTEKMHGQQHYAGVTFTYDDDLTATLAGFQPAS